MQMLKANWAIALRPTEGSECRAKSPEATVYRDEAANRPGTQSGMPDDTQIGMFTPFWVIF
jgi:hypothetical protein